MRMSLGPRTLSTTKIQRFGFALRLNLMRFLYNTPFANYLLLITLYYRNKLLWEVWIVGTAYKVMTLYETWMYVRIWEEGFSFF